MNCAKFESRMTDYMDGALDRGLQEAMSEHAKGCAGCSGLVTRVHSLREQLANFPLIPLPQSLVDTILEKTTGKPQPRSLWGSFILPTIRPFLTQRYAFGTGILLVFISLVFSMIGPTLSTSGYSDLSPASVGESADRLTDNVKKKFAQLRIYQARAYEEAKLLKEDLYGRLDSYVISLLFKSYSQSVNEQKPAPDAQPTAQPTTPPANQPKPAEQKPKQQDDKVTK